MKHHQKRFGDRVSILILEKLKSRDHSFKTRSLQAFNFMVFKSLDHSRKNLQINFNFIYQKQILDKIN